MLQWKALGEGDEPIAQNRLIETESFLLHAQFSYTVMSRLRQPSSQRNPVLHRPSKYQERTERAF
jgi:hypothetical protein